jgi:hypothetical protein
MGFINSEPDRYRRDYSFAFHMVHMYLCKVEEFIINVLGYGSVTAVTDDQYLFANKLILFLPIQHSSLHLLIHP